MEKPSSNFVSLKSASGYEEKLDGLVDRVNHVMLQKNSRNEMIGDNPLSVMYDNHTNHARFMLNVFKLNDYDL